MIYKKGSPLKYCKQSAISVSELISIYLTPLYLDCSTFSYKFESETDTEVIPKLMKYLWDSGKCTNLSFASLVELTVSYLEGAFALVFKSFNFPGEVVATRRGSPLLIGIKSNTKVTTDHIPVFYSSERNKQVHATAELETTPGQPLVILLLLFCCYCFYYHSCFHPIYTFIHNLRHKNYDR